MTLTVRLDYKVEQTLAVYAVDNGISKSEAVKRGLKLLFESTPPQTSSYQAGKHLFGCYESGRPDGSVNHSKYVKEAIRAKHASRHRPPGRPV